MSEFTYLIHRNGKTTDRSSSYQAIDRDMAATCCPFTAMQLHRPETLQCEFFKNVLKHYFNIESHSRTVFTDILKNTFVRKLFLKK